MFELSWVNFSKLLPQKVKDNLKLIKDSLDTDYPNKRTGCGIVGGALRDMALGYTPHDYDYFVVGVTKEQLEESLNKHYTAWSAEVIGVTYPIVFWHKCEINVIESWSDVTEDMKRRDFTINSIYMYYGDDTSWQLEIPPSLLDDLSITGCVLNSWGSIADKIEKDPIKLLRGLRLVAKYNMKFDKDVYFDMFRVRNALKSKSIPVERICDELRKGFMCGNAHRFVQLLDEFEFLEYFFPAVNALKGIDGGHYHNEQVFSHVMCALKALDDVNVPLAVRLAALYHDVGKCEWEISDEGKRRFTKHNVRGAALTRDDLSKWFPRTTVAHVKSLVWHHMHQVDGKHSINRLVISLASDKVPLKHFIWVRYADNMGSAVYKTNFMYYWGLYRKCLQIVRPKHVPSVKDLAINGNDLMKELNIQPGPEIGFILRTLFNRLDNEEAPLANTREDLLSVARELHLHYSISAKVAKNAVV